MMHRLLFVLALTLSATFSLQAAQEVYEFDSPEQETVFKKLGKELRCPKCQNNNIADSNSSLAQDLRTKVYEMLKQGKSEDDIVDYMVDRYGNFVTYNPPLSFSTLILWLGPVVFLLAGFTVLVQRSRSRKSSSVPPSLDDEEQARLTSILDDTEKGSSDYSVQKRITKHDHH